MPVQENSKNTNIIDIVNIFCEIISKSIDDNKKFSINIMTDYNFFEGFSRLYRILKDAYEKKLVKNIKLLFTGKVDLKYKDIEYLLNNESYLIDKEIFLFINDMIESKVLDAHFLLDHRIDYKLFLFNTETDCYGWTGTRSFSKSDKSELSDILVKIESSDLYNENFTVLFKKSQVTINNKSLLDIIKKTIKQNVINLSQRDFISNVIKNQNVDFLVKNISHDLSNTVEYRNSTYYYLLNLLKKYGGAFLIQTCGLGKQEICSMVTKYYLDNNKKVLIIASPADYDQWKLLSSKYSNLQNIEIISRTEISSSDFKYQKYLGINLVIVMDALLYCNKEENNNLKTNFDNIIKININCACLFISDTFFKTGLLEYIELVKYIMKGSYYQVLKSEGIVKVIATLETALLKNDLTKDIIDLFIKIVNTFSVNIKNSDISLYYEGSTGFSIDKSVISQVKYAYDHEIYVKVYDKIVTFFENLTFQYLKLINKSITDDHINLLKLRIHRKLESSIYSYRVILKDLLAKNLFIKKLLLENNKESEKKLFNIEHIINCINNYTENVSTQNDILNNISNDIKNIETTLTGIEGLKYLENRDDKITNLLKILKTENKPTIIFSESKDSVLYVERRLKEYSNFRIGIIYSNEISLEDLDNEIFVNDIPSVINSFHNEEIDILITTDVIDENITFPRCETIINFDITYNVNILRQRFLKFGTVQNKKIKFYNFQPDKRIDRESNILEALNLSNEKIISFAGIDFLSWLINEKQITDFSEANKENILVMLRDYKDLIASKNIDEIQAKVFIQDLKNLIALREYIKLFNISEDTIKIVESNYKKPIYSSFKSEKESLYISFFYKNNFWNIDSLTFSDLPVSKDISSEDFESIIFLIKEKIQSVNSELIDDSKDKSEKPTSVAILKFFK